MMYLLDTNVVSELRRQRPHGAVIQWLEALDENKIFLSAATIGEIQAGVEITRERDTLRADWLENWLAQLVNEWNILSFDAEVFRIYARLMHRKTAALADDALIAATAIANNLTLATRNVRDFEQWEVRLHNPFAD